MSPKLLWGNVILKLYEGVASTLIHAVKGGMLSSLRSKIGALLVKPALKRTLKSLTPASTAAPPLLGLRGLVVKTHGSAKAVEIRHSIQQCLQFREQGLNEKIQQYLLEEKP